jgi:hypothetical protein
MPRERPYSPGDKRAQLASARARRADDIVAGRATAERFNRNGARA